MWRLKVEWWCESVTKWMGGGGKQCKTFHRLFNQSNSSLKSLGISTGSLWWRWGCITFGSSWSSLKQWVSLNNRQCLSSREPPQLLVQLSEFVLCYSLSSCAHWYEIKPYHPIWPKHFPYITFNIKTVIRQNTSSRQLLNNESLFGAGDKSHMFSTRKKCSNT